jgi:hypothetical protein
MFFKDGRSGRSNFKEGSLKKEFWEKLRALISYG